MLLRLPRLLMAGEMIWLAVLFGYPIDMRSVMQLGSWLVTIGMRIGLA